MFADGAFREDSAVLVLASTSLPFRPFKLQHFVPTHERVVVTAADEENRIVHEIDGRPAAAAYARLMGVDVERLDPMLFAAQPIVVLIDGTNYVRSIKSANPDGSLTFFSSIEEGLVLRSARGIDVVENLEQGFAELRNVLGDLQLVIGADCILRRLEYSQTSVLEGVDRVSVGTTSSASIAMANSSVACTSTRQWSVSPSERAMTPESAPLGTDNCACADEITRLNKVVRALVDRAEQNANVQVSEFGLFQTRINLEGEVRRRTAELERHWWRTR